MNYNHEHVALLAKVASKYYDLARFDRDTMQWITIEHVQNNKGMTVYKRLEYPGEDITPEEFEIIIQMNKL